MATIAGLANIGALLDVLPIAFSSDRSYSAFMELLVAYTHSRRSVDSGGRFDKLSSWASFTLAGWPNSPVTLFRPAAWLTWLRPPSARHSTVISTPSRG